MKKEINENKALSQTTVISIPRIINLKYIKNGIRYEFKKNTKNRLRKYK